MSVTKEEQRELSGESMLARMMAVNTRPFNPTGREKATKCGNTALGLCGRCDLGVLLVKDKEERANRQIETGQRNHRHKRRNQGPLHR